MNSKGNAKQQIVNKNQQQIVNKYKMNSNPPPAKKDKRTHSEVSNESQNESNSSSSIFDVSGLQTQLDNISSDIGELKGVLNSILKKEEIENLIQTTLSKIMEGFERRFKEEIDMRILDKTRELKERVQVLEYDNKQLIDRLEKSEKETKRAVSDLVEREKQNDFRSRDAVKRANFNEQYSRKNNVKITNVEEEEGETQVSLEKKVLKLFEENDIVIEKADILAMHRIPSKQSLIKPVLIKTINNEVKTKIMRKRKVMKEKGHRLIDDVTALNTGLISRLSKHDEISSAWFFNGYVYGQTFKAERIRFDIYDSITEAIEAHRQKGKKTKVQ